MVDARKKDFESGFKLVVSGKDKQLQDEIRRMVAKCKRIEQDLLNERSKSSEEDAKNFNLIFIILFPAMSLIA